MQLIIDTCSWKKVQILEDQNILYLKTILYENDLWATHSLIQEYSHYLKDYLDIYKFSIQKVNLVSLKNFTKKQLDDADLSIIEFARTTKNTLVISDDRAELEVLRAFKIPSFQISEYIFTLCRIDLMKKKNAKKAIKFLRSLKNIQEKKKIILLDKIDRLK